MAIFPRPGSVQPRVRWSPGALPLPPSCTKHVPGTVLYHALHQRGQGHLHSPCCLGQSPPWRGFGVVPAAVIAADDGSFVCVASWLQHWVVEAGIWIGRAQDLLTPQANVGRLTCAG